MKQNMHHAFWYISLLSLHHVDEKFPYATLFKHTRRIFLQLQGNSPTFSSLSKLEYILFFLWKKIKRIHFCDISADLADVVAKAPYIYESFISVTLPVWCYIANNRKLV